MVERGGYRPESEKAAAPVAVKIENAPVEQAHVELANREPTSEIPRSELQEAVEAQAQEKEPLAFEKLPEETQLQLIGQMLEGMREAVGSVRDYAVFASTAMYLNGENIVARGDERGRELMKPPGDFDAAVFKQEDLDTIRDRLRRMPDVIFANAMKDREGNIMRDESGEVMYKGRPGEYGKFPGQDTKILAGKRIYDVEINGQPEKVAYDFEFFLDTKMVPRTALRGRMTEAHGLKILNLDGLAAQYERNYDYELRVNKSVSEIVDYLHSDAPEAKQFMAELDGIAEDDNVAFSERTLEILKHFDVGPDEMRKVLDIQRELDNLDKLSDIPYAKLRQEGLLERYVNAYRAAGNEEKAKDIEDTYKYVQSLISKRAALLAGTKTKLWKRDLNLEQLERLRNGE